MHYFSRIVLHKSALTLQEFAELGFGIQATHGLIWKAFGDHGDRDRDFVFRADLENDSIVLWAVSEREPDDWGGKFVVDTKAYAPRLEKGQRLGFELRVNPTVTSRVPGKRGKRHDAVMHHKQGLAPATRESTPEQKLVHDAAVDWMSKKGERVGFSVEAERLRTDAYTQHEFKKTPRSQRSVRLSTLDLSGVLVVEDPEAFVGVLTGGIGSAKAYGNGLFLVRAL